jgi:serine/threonine protein kinase
MASQQQAQGQGKKTVIERFLIGEELGRGAYGQVFKGMDSSTGDVVAIKQIGLGGVSSANLAGVMGEIDLLKTLNHKNIVKYVGSFKTRAHLYIILEYMENGALSSVIKPNRFGVFPETLVAIYIAQVLCGLSYLHDQGVVHRDIKGANILTTKDVSWMCGCGVAWCGGSRVVQRQPTCVSAAVGADTCTSTPALNNTLNRAW